MSTQQPRPRHSRRSKSIAVRVTSPTERMRLGVGACRRLEQALIDRLVFLACAGAFCRRPSGTTRLTHIARLAGLPAAAVWEVIARHALLDGSHDSWVEFAFEESAWATAEGKDEEVAPPPEGVIGVWGCEDLTLRVTYPAWPRDFIDLVLRPPAGRLPGAYHRPAMRRLGRV